MLESDMFSKIETSIFNENKKSRNRYTILFAASPTV